MFATDLAAKLAEQAIAEAVRVAEGSGEDPAIVGDRAGRAVTAMVRRLVADGMTTDSGASRDRAIAELKALELPPVRAAVRAPPAKGEAAVSASVMTSLQGTLPVVVS